MNFFDNVVKSSNALIKERLNNPFGSVAANTNQKQATSDEASQGESPKVEPTTTISQQSTSLANNDDSQQSQPAGTFASQPTDQTAPEENRNGADKFAAIAADAEAVTQKAVAGAKNIGTFLFSMANKAGQTVSQTAKQVKQAVESTTILTDFTREQQEFIKEHGGSLQAAELPWNDCADETRAVDMREQILSLSQDRRNFVRSPPADANFQFEPQKCYPIALSLLKEDPNLSKMRFELVPKLVNEDTFWRNYFYRVSLLQLISDRGGDIKNQGWSSSRSSSGEGPDEILGTDEGGNQIEESSSPSYSNQAQQSFSLDTTTTTLPDNQSQELESSESRKLVAEADDLKSKLRELNIGSLDDGGDQDDNDKWEEELQRDLQEFELVSGDVSALDEEALDKEIMELEKSKSKKT